MLIVYLEKLNGLYVTYSVAMTLSLSLFCTKISVQHPVLPQSPSMALAISAHLDTFGCLVRR